MQRTDPMEILLAALGGFFLDLLLGDPAWIPHPVVGMGRCIVRLESCLRAIFSKTPRGERAAGAVLAAALPLGTLALSLGLLRLCRRIHPALAFTLEILWCWQSLAVRGLAEESEHVRRRLAEGTLEEARLAVGRSPRVFRKHRRKKAQGGIRVSPCSVSSICLREMRWPPLAEGSVR